MPGKRLEMHVDSLGALRAEFEKNIVNRGLFVLTEAALEVRQPIQVAIVLRYAGAPPDPVLLTGEIVHRVPPEMARRGGKPGVAVQLEESVAELRARFEPLFGGAPIPDPNVDREGEGRRSARREPVRVPIEIQVGERPAVRVTTRDLSGSGVLLSTRDHPFVVGDSVRIRMRAADGAGEARVAGRVVREVKNKSGAVAAVAIAFDAKQAADTKLKAVVERLLETSHRGRLGEVKGAIGPEGVAGLIESFSGSMPSGTLVLERDGEQGFIAFSKDRFVAAEVGALSGVRAVEVLLGWTGGSFALEARVDGGLLERGKGEPLSAVLLEAACARDAHEAEPDTADAGVGGCATFDFGPEATFLAVAGREPSTNTELGKTEEAVLDLARAGMSVARMQSVIPEPPARVEEAIASLIEQGVLRVRESHAAVGRPQAGGRKR